MKKIAIKKATAPLAQYARVLHGSPLVVTEDGRPVAALVPITDMDMETLAVGTSPAFLEVIERSRRRQDAEGGIRTAELRAKLDLPPGKAKPIRGKARRTAS